MEVRCAARKSLRRTSRDRRQIALIAIYVQGQPEAGLCLSDKYAFNFYCKIAIFLII